MSIALIALVNSCVTARLHLLVWADTSFPYVYYFWDYKLKNFSTKSSKNVEAFSGCFCTVVRQCLFWAPSPSMAFFPFDGCRAFPAVFCYLVLSFLCTFLSVLTIHSPLPCPWLDVFLNIYLYCCLVLALPDQFCSSLLTAFIKHELQIQLLCSIRPYLKSCSWVIFMILEKKTAVLEQLGNFPELSFLKIIKLSMVFVLIHFLFLCFRSLFIPLFKQNSMFSWENGIIFLKWKDFEVSCGFNTICCGEHLVKVVRFAFVFFINSPPVFWLKAAPPNEVECTSLISMWTFVSVYLFDLTVPRRRFQVVPVLTCHILGLIKLTGVPWHCVLGMKEQLCSTWRLEEIVIW